MVKNSYSSTRGPGFCSQLPHGDSQPPVMSVSGVPTPSSDLFRHQVRTWYTNTRVSKTLIHRKINKSLKKNAESLFPRWSSHIPSDVQLASASCAPHMQSAPSPAGKSLAHLLGISAVCADAVSTLKQPHLPRLQPLNKSAFVCFMD